jgi:predicted amidohydrolase
MYAKLMSSDFFEDPADLFVQLYDELGEHPFRGAVPAQQWWADPSVQADARRVCLKVLETGIAPRNLVSRLAQSDRGMFAVLVGLDDALEYVHPFSATYDPGRLYRIAVRYVTSGRLNSDAVDGALLVRNVFPGRPAGLPDREDFFGVVRVPRDAWADVEHSRIPNAFDLPFMRPEKSDSATIGVACIPMLGSYDDLVFQQTDRAGAPAYRIGPQTEVLERRIEKVLEILDESRAFIGVLPEAALSEKLLMVWSETLRRKEPPKSSNLCWLFVGTGPCGGQSPPPNRAVLLHRSGQVLLEQDKINDFTMTPGQLDRWGLNGLLGHGPRVEDIARGDTVRLLECALGRIGVLICEDLTRPRISNALRGCGISHVFVPIFSGPVHPSWVTGSATSYVVDVGASVVVVTSLAIARAIGRKGPVAVCAWFGPRDPNRAEWHFEPTIGECSEPDELCGPLQVAAGPLHRFTDFRT